MDIQYTQRQLSIVDMKINLSWIRETEIIAEKGKNFKFVKNTVASVSNQITFFTRLHISRAECCLTR